MESILENDEAMAKRLAKEWANEDQSINLEEGIDELPTDLSDIMMEEVHSGTSHETSTSSTSLSMGMRPARSSTDASNPQSSQSYISAPVRPDEGLTPFRLRLGPVANVVIDQSPRGCVGDIMMRFSTYVPLT